MGFLKKVLSREKDEEAEAATVVDNLPVSEALDVDVASPPLNLGDTSAADEEDVLAQYADLADSADPPVAPVEDGPAADGPAAALVEEPDETETESDDNDLMDIFTTEEEEDAVLSAMTDSLEDLDIHSLLAEAIDVSAELQTLIEAQ